MDGAGGRGGRLRVPAIAFVLALLAACGGGDTGAGATLVPGATAPNFARGTPAAPVLPRVDPIQARFDEGAKSTTYTVVVYVGDRKLEALLNDPRAAFDVRMAGPTCGTTREGAIGVRQDDLAINYSFIWSHPHPPCDPTTDHSDTTITITVANGAGTIACTYQGAATGVSRDPCVKL